MIKSMTMSTKLTIYLSVCVLLATVCSAAPLQSRQGPPPPHHEHLTFTLTKGEAVNLLLTFIDYLYALKSGSATFSAGIDYLVSAGISVENLTYEEILALLDEYLKT